VPTIPKPERLPTGLARQMQSSALHAEEPELM